MKDAREELEAGRGGGRDGRREGREREDALGAAEDGLSSVSFPLCRISYFTSFLKTKPRAQMMMNEVDLIGSLRRPGVLKHTWQSSIKLKISYIVPNKQQCTEDCGTARPV